MVTMRLCKASGSQWGRGVGWSVGVGAWGSTQRTEISNHILSQILPKGGQPLVQPGVCSLSLIHSETQVASLLQALQACEGLLSSLL